MEVNSKRDDTEKVVMSAGRSHCGGACLLKVQVLDVKMQEETYA